MKKILFSLAILILLSIVCASTFAQTIKFDKLSHSLGKINLSDLKDSVVYYDFNFINIGDKTIHIEYILSNCGCTTTAWNREGYEPGAKGVIRMSYRPHLREQRQVSMLADVYSNSGVHNLRVDVSFEGDTIPLIPYYKLEESTELIITQREITSDVYTTILRRATKEIQMGFSETTDKTVEQLSATMRRGGYWQHIDYGCNFRTNWQPIEHISNLRTMALAYITPASKYYASASLFTIIEKGLSYWDITNPSSNNWWFNEIGGSQVLTDVLVLLFFGDNILDEELFNSICDKLDKGSDSRKWTGANKLDIAKHHIYRGCLIRNDSIVRMSSDEIFFPVKISQKEGIQEDMSYHQHGPQLYMGGYGLIFSGGISEMAYILRDTPYALSEKKLALFSRFIREGFLQVFRGQYIDWSVTGRGISRKGIIENKGLIAETGLDAVLERMIHIDPEHKEFYVQTKERFKGDITTGVKTKNTLFHRSDYMTHSRPTFQATVRTASIRGTKTEQGNGENLFCTYLTDGAFNIRQQGDEYNEIFSVWEWDKIPGTTSLKEIIPTKGIWGEKGVSKWTAGVSNGEVGAFAYKHDDHGFKATKGWFFWDDMVVALGTGITSDTVALHTTLDQVHLRSRVTFKEQTEKTITVDTISVLLKNPDYVIHNQMAYIPLEDALITLRASTQAGSWIDINYNEPSTIVKNKVFNLVWEHLKGKGNTSYSYIQLPAYNSIKQIGKAKKSIEIVNNSSLQAVYKKMENKAMAIFYDKGSYEVGKWNISVDKPALLIIDGINGEDEIVVTVVNLNGDSTPIEVKLNRKKVNQVLHISTNKMQPSTITFIVEK